jgi:hypothetical protein
MMLDKILNTLGLVRYAKYKEDIRITKKVALEEGYESARINRCNFVNLPKQAVPSVIESVVSECIDFYTQYELKNLYLIGSRAKGTAKDNSDHDFVVVIGDDAPDEIVQDNGSYGNLGLARIRKAVTNVPKSPDIIVCRESVFLARKDIPTEGFPYEAEHYGCKIQLNGN